ncbi:MAG: ATP-binding protein, partial [bacterium]|nr:ATP-binding protein [bacterium]
MSAAREEPVAYRDSYEHFDEELGKLDLVIGLRVAALRSRPSAEAEETVSRHLHVSHREVDLLLAPAAEAGSVAAEEEALEARTNRIARRVSASAEQGVDLTLPRLARLFALSPFELGAVVICLAPELDRKYDRLYAYLQDDVTRKKPSVDLVLELLCPSRFERWRVRALFADHAPLLRAGILETTGDPQSPSGSSDLARFLKLDGRILSFLLENPGLEGRLVGMVELHERPQPLAGVAVDDQTKTRLLNLARNVFAGERDEPGRLTLHLHGPRGVGKRELAMGLCAELGCALLILDAELLPADPREAAVLLRLALREGLLQQAAVLVDRADALATGDEAAARCKLLAGAIAEYGWLTLLAGEKPQPLRELFRGTGFQAVGLPMPAVNLRERIWREALAELDCEDGAGWPAQLAARFRLTPGQVRDACREVDNRRHMSAPPRPPGLDDLHAACRGQSNPRLSELAIKIEPRYGWDDIVLPAPALAHLGEICHQVRQRHRVFGDWGFDRKLSHGKGLSALFSGAPGTGKTMAAEVLAHELGLDLYKIDLSGVVSKYIGETEKNLARIFAEAESSNAILFFDEADALFGRRTEVRDAHDRYANIETSYLLQRIEEYEGVAILATNLLQNIDDAFLRRIRFIVELPFPDRERRREIWRNLFPRQAPVSDAVDYELLAERFRLAGGNIRNIVLNAAFLAAQNGGVIEMGHILRGARREYEKI